MTNMLYKVTVFCNHVTETHTKLSGVLCLCSDWTFLSYCAGITNAETLNHHYVDVLLMKCFNWYTPMIIFSLSVSGEVY